jgi:Kef-type K+ transport system membrane component KefB
VHRKLLPEVVLLLVAGVLTGPNVPRPGLPRRGDRAVAQARAGRLFLLAGYEVELKELTARGGGRAMVTWLICVGLAFAIVWLIGLSRAVNAEVPVAIALTSTALGALLTILQDSGQLGTRFSDAIMNHGAGGSSARRSPWQSC